jgi:hypothetical protein
VSIPRTESSPDPEMVGNGVGGAATGLRRGLCVDLAPLCQATSDQLLCFQRIEQWADGTSLEGLEAVARWLDAAHVAPEAVSDFEGERLTDRIAPAPPISKAQVAKSPTQ